MEILENKDDKRIPSNLYKYKPIDKDGFTFDLIITDLLYIGNVYGFEDTNEGLIRFDAYGLLKLNVEKILKSPEIIQLFSKEDYELIISSEDSYDKLKEYIYDDEEIQSNISFKEFSKIIDGGLIELIEGIYSQFNDFLKENTLISCFTIHNKNEYMWQNYADEDTGICIEYNFYDLEDFSVVDHINKINYFEKENFPDSTLELFEIPNTNMQYFMEDIFLNKTMEWNLEKEWRLSFFNHPVFRHIIKKINSNKHYIKLPKPRAIFLGSDISKKNKNKIIEICKNREISVFQMKKEDEYSIIPEHIYPQGRWDEINYVKECIKTDNLKSLLFEYFFLERIIEKQKIREYLLIESFNELDSSDISKFLDTLLFKNGIFPVLSSYYSNVLSFLIQLNVHDSFKYIKTKDGRSIEENLKKWISFCLTKFNDEEILRFLYSFELILEPFYSRYVVLNEIDKKEFSEKFGYTVDLKYVPLIKDEFENGDSEIYLHSLIDGDYDNLIKKNILKNLNEIFEGYYVEGNFDDKKCFEEWNRLNNLVENIVNKTNLKFKEIYNNSKSGIPYGQREIINQVYFDYFISAICGILKINEDSLKLLSDKDKRILRSIAEIRYEDSRFEKPLKIANYADECCDFLQIKYNPKIYGLDFLKGYRNPKFNLYELK